MNCIGPIARGNPAIGIVSVVIADDAQVVAGAVKADTTNGGTHVSVGCQRRAPVGAVMALHLSDARQRGPCDMALRVLDLGDPGGVSVGLERGDRNFQDLRALFRPVTKLIRGPATGMRVHRRHRISRRRRHAFGDEQAELPGATGRQEHRGRAYHGDGPQPTSRRHDTPLYPVQPRSSSHGFCGSPSIRGLIVGPCASWSFL